MNIVKKSLLFFPSDISGVSVVNLRINQNNREFNALRINLKDDNSVRKLIRKLVPFRLKNKVANTEGLVKRTVRVDTDIHNALFCKIDAKEFITRKGNKAVVDRIKTKVIDVIRTEGFRHRITLYFTEKEYQLIDDVVRQIKDKGLRFFTFSLLVRSILYEELNLVSEIKVSDDAA